MENANWLTHTSDWLAVTKSHCQRRSSSSGNDRKQNKRKSDWPLEGEMEEEGTF